MFIKLYSLMISKYKLVSWIFVFLYMLELELIKGFRVQYLTTRFSVFRVTPFAVYTRLDPSENFKYLTRDPDPHTPKTRELLSFVETKETKQQRKGDQGSSLANQENRINLGNTKIQEIRDLEYILVTDFGEIQENIHFEFGRTYIMLSVEYRKHGKLCNPAAVGQSSFVDKVIILLQSIGTRTDFVILSWQIYWKIIVNEIYRSSEIRKMAADLFYEGRIITISRFYVLQAADIHVVNRIYNLRARRRQIMFSAIRRSKYKIVFY